ncbi:hypothetical protein [Microvirga zambiensis]|uniref:hypothetical protein n=1 Tax=Microvirga zambiensis TaxID=1402137 RepID=UPI00191E6D95|nr:hypothetical protein [Microvirga zambiensis]
MDHPISNDASSVEQAGSRKRRRAATRPPQAHSLPTLIAPEVDAEALLRGRGWRRGRRCEGSAWNPQNTGSVQRHRTSPKKRTAHH